MACLLAAVYCVAACSSSDSVSDNAPNPANAGAAGRVGAGAGGNVGASGSGASSAGSAVGIGGAGGSSMNAAGSLNIGGVGGAAGSITSGASGSGGSHAGAFGGTGGNTASGGAAGGMSLGGAAGQAGGGGDTVNAATMAATMGFGTNIGNTFDNTTRWETGWSEPLVTQVYINGMASHGIKTVRVPVAWNTYAVGGVIDATKMNRVKQVVGWILDAGMYAIVNIHWDGGWIDNEGKANQYQLTSDVKTKFAAYWTQIATAFASVGNKLIFEGLNEEGRYYVNGNVNGTPDYAALNTINQLFVTTVRAQAGYNAGRGLLIAGFTTNIDLTCVSAFTIPNDPAGPGKIFLSLHYYSPWNFCGLDNVASYGSPATTWGSSAEKAALQSDFSKLAACSAQKKVPIILGEFGVIKGGKYPRQPASRSLWMESVAKACLSTGMVPVLWDTGTDITRSNGSFSPELQTVMTDLK